MGNCFGVQYGSSQTNNYVNDYYSAGSCSMRGCRRTMEDCFAVYLSIPNHSTYSFFGIFDGFNGSQASTYLSTHLINTLSKLQRLNDDKLIIDAINNMDKDFLNLETIHQSGSTIVFALIRPSKSGSCCSESMPLCDIASSSSDLSQKCNTESISDTKQKYEVNVFWLGDSRATLLTNKMEHEELTSDHHCTVETERKRLEENYDCTDIIINNKIDGITELSRSFGCYPMKNNKELNFNQQKHICIASVTKRLCETNDTLLLYCDGLSEKWNTKRLISKYKHHSNQTKDDKNPMQNCLNYLCEECIDDGSMDNITVIAVKFK